MPEKVSVIFSVFNEEGSLPALFNGLRQLAGRQGGEWEFLFVDDGSNDASAALIRQFCTEATPEVTVRLIRFSRNFGHEAAMIAGIDHASGEALLCLDADLQHPLAMIPGMIDRYRKGKEIVIMNRKSNLGNSPAGNFFSSLFYGLINRLSPDKLQKNSSDFFLISRQVAELLRHDFRERNRFLRGIIQIIGFPSDALTYEAPARIAGKTKYSFLKLTRLTARAITSFSNAPLYLGIWFGFFFALLSLILGLYSLWVFFFGQTPPSGYTTIILFLSVSFAILFFLIGIIGIYTGYLFDEQKKRPLYIVEESVPPAKPSSPTKP
ncbi:MAG TPA: glycosyltransferase family 2 protein [Prolixibacteraceae bacterium]|nr:glycosyltransferase family 2 protein [Prolixibacteraceae bacterium]